MIKRLVFSAALSGLIAGLVITLLQSVTVIPMILEAETFEPAQTATIQHEHAHDSPGDHHHDTDEWAPQDGNERFSYTALTNILAAIGFALLLATCFTFLNHIDWRKGILWGLGGFMAFQLAPSLGLPPELPGTAAAALEARQIWWLITAFSTAIGLICLFISKSMLLKVAGIMFVLMPHVIGAPQPSTHETLAPQSLVTQFIVTTTILGAVFWIILGALTAYTHTKFNRLINKDTTHA